MFLPLIFVNEGDLLVTLNTLELNARLHQSRESLAGVQAPVREAESDFERTQRLLKLNAVSQQEYEVAERKLDVAQANEPRSQQAVKEAFSFDSWNERKLVDLIENQVASPV